MNSSLRALAALCASMGLAAGALAAQAGGASGETLIRVEPEVQPFEDSSAGLAKTKHPRANRVAPLQLAAPGPAEGAEIHAARKVGVPLQIGFNREVPGLDDEATTVSSLEWEAQPGGGYLGALSIGSPGAAALRVGLLVNHIPPGASLRFYGPGDERLFEVAGREILDTIARNLAAGESGREARTYWSPVIESETIVMEIELPAGARPSELRIAAPRISHLVTSSRMDFQVPKAAAACEIDAMCQAGTWGNQMNAVARMVFSTGSGSFLCTGTLLVDQDPSTSIPYFLSANHCISTASAASSLQTYWFYRSSSCNSGTIGSSVTLSGGAALLYASGTTDTSFMRLNNAPPGGAVYAGWALSPAQVGAGTTGLHHPSGDLLKISGGSIQGYWTCTPSTGGQFSCSQASAGAGTFYESAWSSGLTEPGSSGSGLFLNSGGYLIGQLLGGSGSCTSPATDYYGRLDVAYAAGLSAWLGPNPTPQQYSLGITKSGTGAGTVSSSPAGINCGATCTASFASGTAVALTAAPASGSTFSGWNGSCAGTGACSVTMDTTRGVGAVFTLSTPPSPPPTVTYTLSVSKAGTGTGTITSSPAGISCGASCSASFTQGSVVSLTAAPAAGSTFASWGGLCSGTGSCVVPMSSAASVTANFTAGSPAPAPTINYTDMWWSASESGWGLNVIQHASGNIFAIWYTYGADGKRVWYHMPGGTWSSSTTFSGTIYATAGPSFAQGFDPNRVTRSAVGTGILTFSDANSGTWRFSINGVAGVKIITRLQY